MSTHSPDGAAVRFGFTVSGRPWEAWTAQGPDGSDVWAARSCAVAIYGPTGVIEREVGVGSAIVAPTLEALLDAVEAAAGEIKIG